MKIDPKFVAKKIELAKKYLGETRELFKADDYDILHSSGNLHIAERLFQLIVDYVLDINKHFIKQLDLEPPDNLQNTFDTLANSGILEKEFSQKIAGVVGLRNRVVHRYETLDNKEFLTKFRQNNSDFDEYFRQILSYLEKTGF